MSENEETSYLVKYDSVKCSREVRLCPVKNNADANEEWQSLADCTCLENRRVETLRGFESLLLGQTMVTLVLAVSTQVCGTCRTSSNLVCHPKKRPGGGMATQTAATRFYAGSNPVSGSKVA